VETRAVLPSLVRMVDWCRKREPIEAALPDHALAANVAAHELGELARDRKPEARDLAEIAVDLDARLEQAILYGLAQTDAGIDDVESELQATGLFCGARMQAHGADRAVFERVVDQPHQHLAKPRGVSNDKAWAPMSTLPVRVRPLSFARACNSAATS